MRHPVNVRHVDERTRGERAADRLASFVGSWRFILAQSVAMGAWVTLNLVGVFARRWDPYPFILLNLVLSTQAAYTGPVLQLSQNRQSVRDRDKAEHDYDVNAQALALISELHAELVVRGERPDRP